MSLGVFIQRRKHDGKDGTAVVTDQGHDVLVVPEIKCSLSDLKVRRRHTETDSTKQGQHDLGKLRGFNHIQDFLEFIQEHDFLGTVNLWPVSQETRDHLLSKTWILLKKLDNTVGKLRMVYGETLRFMKRHQDLREERLVFFFERQSKAIYDRTQNLQ